MRHIPTGGTGRHIPTGGTGRRPHQRGARA